MNPTVRKATKEDLPILDTFMDALVDAERPMDSTIKNGKVVYYNLENFIINEDSILYVVELNKEIVASGYAKIKSNKSHLKNNKHAYLGFMFVPEKHRGNGYNKLIVDALLTWSKTKNVSEIRLDVYNSNPPAIRAYKKVGFQKHMIEMRMNIDDLEN